MTNEERDYCIKALLIAVGKSLLGSEKGMNSEQRFRVLNAARKLAGLDKELSKEDK